MRSSFVLSIALTSIALISSCGAHREATAPSLAKVTPTTAATSKPVDHGPPLDFILDPVQRDPDWTAASEALRGKRAIVLVLTSWDGGSLVLLRELSPLLRTLPSDGACLLVAMQPLSDRTLVAEFFDAEETPCARAIGDPSRGRLGDLSKVTVIPATLVLRADGTMVGVAPGQVKAKEVREVFEQAK